MRRQFPAPVSIVRRLLYGPEPVGEAGAAVLQRELFAELSGQMGTPHAFLNGGPETTFFGYAEDPQTFVGAAQLGATRNPPVQEYPALPAGQPPAALPQWLQTWQRDEGVVP
jgi:hypothetical protein